jgi:hypothetical protein
MKSLTFSVVSFALLFTYPCRAADDYQLGPESQVKADVPSGKEEPLDLGVSTIFPGATHEAWVYVPNPPAS